MKGNQNENEFASCLGGYVSSFILEVDLLPCWNNKPILISSKIALNVIFILSFLLFFFSLSTVTQVTSQFTFTLTIS